MVKVVQYSEMLKQISDTLDIEDVLSWHINYFQSPCQLRKILCFPHETYTASSGVSVTLQ